MLMNIMEKENWFKQVPDQLNRFLQEAISWDRISIVDMLLANDTDSNTLFRVAYGNPYYIGVNVDFICPVFTKFNITFYELGQIEDLLIKAGAGN